MRPEHQLQVSCVEFIRAMCPNVLVSASQNGLYAGSKGAWHVAAAKKAGLLPGEPDLMLTWANRGILFVELKAGANKPTPDQLSVIATRQKQGFPCEVCWTLNHFVAALAKHGVPTRKGLYAGVERVQP